MTIKTVIKQALFRPGLRPRTIRGGPMAGLRLNLDLRQDTQVWRGIYERRLMDWLQQHVPAEGVCLDVGAAEGVMTLWMAVLAPQGRVIAIEPSERGEQINPNLHLNRDRPLGRVELHRVCAGKQTFFNEQEIEFVAIDDLIARCGLDRLDVIKIDVDGPELDVLDGATASLDRFKPAVSVEAHSHALTRGVVERLEKHGYRCDVVDPPPHEHRPIEYNPTIFAEAVDEMP